MTSEDIVIEFVPPLVALLVRAEQDKGAPLTEEEVIRVRDEAVTIASPASIAQAMADARGYDDLDPERAWEQWQQVREQLLP